MLNGVGLQEDILKAESALNVHPLPPSIQTY
jgi:hypothetical protein